MTGCTSGGYDQLETSSETIKQELRPAVCEHRQTDLRRIIVILVIIIFLMIYSTTKIFINKMMQIDHKKKTNSEVEYNITLIPEISSCCTNC